MPNKQVLIVPLNRRVRGSSPRQSTNLDHNGLFFIAEGEAKIDKSLLTLRVYKPRASPGRKLPVWAIRLQLAYRQTPHTTLPRQSTTLNPLF